MSQVRCGFLEPINDKSNRKFSGHINLKGALDNQVVLRIHPRAQPGNDESRAPSHEVFLVERGREICIGSAWTKNTANVGDFLSMTLDMVSWPRPVNLVCFPPDQKGEKRWTVLWSRPRRQGEPKDDGPDYGEVDTTSDSREFAHEN